MQYGIYYAYWEHEWNGDYHYYIDKVAKLGYDILEIAAGPLPEYSAAELKALKEHAKEKNIKLTVGYGPLRVLQELQSWEGLHRNVESKY